ncbi:hypothetical protein D6C78_11080, partial [Aureobasidium pullulans]
MAQREAQIELALTAIRTGEVNSIRAAERAYNIPESTLRARLNGTTNRRTAHQYRKRLSIRQEDGSSNKTLKASPLRTLVLAKWRLEFYLGNEFVTKFIRDNPRIASVVGRPIEAARINGTNPEAIQEFYTLYEDIIRRFRIQPCNTWNMDEHGIAVS